MDEKSNLDPVCSVVATKGKFSFRKVVFLAKNTCLAQSFPSFFSLCHFVLINITSLERKSKINWNWIINVDNFIFQVHRLFLAFFLMKLFLSRSELRAVKKFSSWVRIFHHFDSVTPPLGLHAPFIKVFKAFASNWFSTHQTRSQCLKITEKVAFNIASEASYVYILSSQKVLPDRSLLIRQKLVENAKIEKLKWDILDDFQPLCHIWIFNLPIFILIVIQFLAR